MTLKRILIELRTPILELSKVESIAMGLEGVGGFAHEKGWMMPLEPAPEVTAGAGSGNAVIRGLAEEYEIDKLKSRPDVVVYGDTVIAPFTEKKVHSEFLQLTTGCGPYDCDPGTPKGAWQDAAKYLKATDVWAEGYKGQNIVVAVADGGIDKSQFPDKILDGWSPDPNSPWGVDPDWGNHGCMCAFDALAMAPEAKIYDIAIGKSGSTTMTGFISDALAGYQWALDHYKKDKTPHIVSGSWGIFQENWDPDYATNPNHPFTRKVAEMVKAGIIITFSAGNCGENCPDSRCGTDIGPGRSIWGANGSKPVITVAAVNINDQLAGYSSRGPAALDKKKPDVCGATHFKGYFSSDTGTSAANPTVAGIAALLKSAKPDLTPEEVKKCLQTTARNICRPGWDVYSGYGVVDARAALDCIRPIDIAKCCDMLSKKLDKLIEMLEELKEKH